MLVDNEPYRTVWMRDGKTIMIDQNALPFHFTTFTASSYHDVCEAIRNMTIRGAPAIGAAAAYGLAQAAIESNGSIDYIRRARNELDSTRPTAQNLFFCNTESS